VQVGENLVLFFHGIVSVAAASRRRTAVSVHGNTVHHMNILLRLLLFVNEKERPAAYFGRPFPATV